MAPSEQHSNQSPSLEKDQRLIQSPVHQRPKRKAKQIVVGGTS